MADPKGALSTLDPSAKVEDEEVVEKPTTGALSTPTKMTTTKGGAQIINPNTMSYSDPESSRAILENMQRMIEQKEKQQNSLLTALNLASAYGSGGAEGPQRQVQAQMAQHEAGNTEIFNMRQAIAQQKAAQRQNEIFNTQRAATLGTQPTTAGAASTQGAVAVNPSATVGQPGFMSPEIRTALANAPTKADYDKIYNQWAQDQSKQSTAAGFKKQELQYASQFTPGYIERKPVFIPELGDNLDLNFEEAKALDTTGKLPSRYSSLQKEFDEKKGKPAAPASAPAAAPAAAPATTDKSSLQQTSYQSPVSGTVVRGVTPNHGGVDIAVPVNTPVAATRSGTLRYNTTNTGGWGNAAEIVDANGKVIERLAHLNKFTMPEGSVVKTGDKIGLSGGQQGTPGAGNSKGPHVHHELPGSNAFQNVSLKRPTSAEDVKKRQELDIDIEKNRARLAEETAQAGPKRAAEERVVKDEKARDVFLLETDPATTSKQRSDATALVSKITSNPKIVGVFADPGFVNAAGSLLKQGIEVGRFGSLSVNLEDAYLQAFDKKYGKQDTVTRAEAKQLFANLELEKSKILNGQGPISDNERLLLSRAVGGVSDPAELIVKTARALKMISDFRDAAREIHGSTGTGSFQQFKDSAQYRGLVKRYETEFDKLHAEKINLGKPAGAQSPGKAPHPGEALVNKYRTKPQ